MNERRAHIEMVIVERSGVSTTISISETDLDPKLIEQGLDPLGVMLGFINHRLQNAYGQDILEIGATVTRKVKAIICEGLRQSFAFHVDHGHVHRFDICVDPFCRVYSPARRTDFLLEVDRVHDGYSESGVDTFTQAVDNNSTTKKEVNNEDASADA